MAFTKEQILDLYKAEASKHGKRGTSTIQDIRTRRLEVSALLSYLQDGYRVLEVGCGNGYVAQAIVERFAVKLDAIDFSPEMISIATQRQITAARGEVSFRLQDVLALTTETQYDLVFTERCLQNLASWDDQRLALSNIVRSLKRNGWFVMLEAFWTGLNRLNEARRELDLPEIQRPWHNLFFDEEKTKEHIASIGCHYVDQNCLLSGYYFGSRVLYPALLPKGKVATSQSVLNDYFCELPPHSDFCPIKILRFRKKGVALVGRSESMLNGDVSVSCPNEASER